MTFENRDLMVKGGETLAAAWFFLSQGVGSDVPRRRVYSALCDTHNGL